MVGGIDREPKGEVHGIAHITGEGILGGLRRMLMLTDLGAFLENPIMPPEVMIYAQTLAKIPMTEAYQTWNMGHGMIIATPSPQEIIKVAQAHNIEAQVVGTVTRDPAIRIRTFDKCGELGEVLRF